MSNVSHGDLYFTISMPLAAARRSVPQWSEGTMIFSDISWRRHDEQELAGIIMKGIYIAELIVILEYASIVTVTTTPLNIAHLAGKGFRGSGLIAISWNGVT
jgi:hypothetical protein